MKTYGYARDDRVTGITYTNAVNPTPNVSFTWDPYFPRLTAMTDGIGTVNESTSTVRDVASQQRQVVDQLGQRVEGALGHIGTMR